MGLTIATLTDCHLEDIESSKYQPVFASAENVLVKPIFFVDEKKQPHRFTGICRFASNEIWRVNLRVQLFVGVWINSSCTQGFPFGKYTVEQISAHICDRGGGLSKLFLFWLKKTASPFHSSCVCFCRKTVLPVLIQLTFIGYLLIFQMQ